MSAPVRRRVQLFHRLDRRQIGNHFAKPIGNLGVEALRLAGFDKAAKSLVANALYLHHPYNNAKHDKRQVTHDSLRVFYTRLQSTESHWKSGWRVDVGVAECFRG